MRLLRPGGQHAATREAQLWFALVAILLTALAAAIVLHNPVVALAVAGPVLVATKPVRQRLTNVRKGRLGEESVTELLGRLSDDYCLVNDVTLPGVHGNIDHILIGPCGVVVIETKRIAGEIKCQGDYWYVNRYRRHSISKQVNRGAVVVRRFLERRHPDLPGWTIGFVESVIVFTHPLCRLTPHRSKAIIVRYSQLLQLITDLSKKHHMSVAVAERLAMSLAAA